MTAVVDRQLRGRGRKKPLFEAHEAETSVPPWPRRSALRWRMVGCERIQLFEESWARTEQENAAVPEVIGDRPAKRWGSVCGPASRGMRQPLSCRRRECRRGGCSRSRYLGPLGGTLNSTSLPVAAISRAALHARDKGGGVFDQVVGGQDGNDGVAAILARCDSRGRDGRRCIPRETALENDRLRLDAGALHLLADKETVVVVTDNDRGGEPGFSAVSRRKVAPSRSALPVREADELFGIHGARQRPKAGLRSRRTE